jgi:hypothetical protein
MPIFAVADVGVLLATLRVDDQPIKGIPDLSGLLGVT